MTLPLAIVLAYRCIPASIRGRFGGRPTSHRALQQIRGGGGWPALIRGVTDRPSPRHWD
jgi:hypothetical protein